MEGEAVREFSPRERLILGAIQSAIPDELANRRADFSTEWTERDDGEGLYPDFVVRPTNPRACPMRFWLTYSDDAFRDVIVITLGLRETDFLAYIPRMNPGDWDDLVSALEGPSHAVVAGEVILSARPERIDPEMFVDGEPAPEHEWKDGWELHSKLRFGGDGSSSRNLIEGDLRHPLTGEVIAERSEASFTFEPYAV